MPITLDTFRILVIVAGMAFLAACDTSENPDLLNPPGSDSTRARAINLASNDDLNVTIGAQSIATGLSAATTGPDALLFFNDAVAVAFRFGQRSDTLASSPIPRTVDDEILLSWIGMATPSKTTLATVLTSRIESGTLSSGDQARIYFFHGTDSAGLSLHQDCPNGPAIFAGVPDVALGGSSDLGVGSYSLYIGGFSGAPSARLELQPGAIVGLALRLKADGTPELVSFDLSPDAPERAPIETTMAETITTGQIRLVNGLGDSPIDATMLETSEPVAVGLPTGGISDVAEITPCSGSAGDSLAVVVAGNTTHLAVSPSIGAARTVLVFREDGTLRAQTLAPPTEAESGMVRFRAINIATSDSILAVQAGAGAPGTLAGKVRPGIRTQPKPR